MLHGGLSPTGSSRVVSREALHKVPNPIALPNWHKKGRPKNYYWKPVGHGDLADSFVMAVEDLGIRITSEKHMLFRKDHALISTLGIEPTNMLDPSWESFVHSHESFQGSGIQPFICVRHSNDGVFGISVMGGAMVKVCSNGMYGKRFGRVKVNTPHSRDLDISEYMAESVRRVVADFDAIERAKLTMERRELSEDAGCRLILEAANAGVLDEKLILPTSSAWLYPEHTSFEPRNAWSWYNAVTNSAKKLPPNNQVNLLADANSFILNQTSPLNA